MHIDLDTLEAKARAAKAVWPGPWRAAPRPADNPDDNAAPGITQGLAWTVARQPDTGTPSQNSECSVPKAVAEHMAAATPDIMLALIEAVRAWR